VTSTTRIRLLLALLSLASGFLVYSLFRAPAPEIVHPELPFSDFIIEVERGQVREVEFVNGSARITGELVSGETFTTLIPPLYTGDVTEVLITADAPILVSTVPAPSGGVNWAIVLQTGVPILFMFVLVWMILSRMSGGKKDRKKFTDKTRKEQEDLERVTFDDVAGANEAIVELGEIREFLRDPKRFTDIGAKIPKGVLLYGPPGTGKTLLARAVAGEAGVPFFTLSGSDFVEKFAGVGASRVRNLFEDARNEAPAIIFVDEIDAVGRHRGGSSLAGNEEREQTLNQLLVEMDGFDATTGVIFIAATNRPDILDSALLRPGRFDRQIAVETPDLTGRREILAVHAKGKTLGPDAEIDTIARRTPGFTGADLANLLNEAALLSARRGKDEIGDAEIDAALDRVIAGPEKGANTLSPKEKLVIAFHEAGHAVVGHVLPNADPIHKVSIIARGKALGFTLALPEKDKILRTQSELEDEMAMLLGGRIAEEIIFGDPTTGAHDDLRRVTEIAQSMVTKYGMSKELGYQRFGRETGEAYAPGHSANYSDEIAGRIDAEIRGLIDAASREAREVLTLHRPLLDQMAGALIEKETLNKAELDAMFAEHGLAKDPDGETIVDLREAHKLA